MIRWLAVVALAGCTSAAGSAAPAPAPTPAPVTAPVTAPVAPRPTSAMLAAMAALVGATVAPDQLDAWAQRLDHGDAQLDGFLDELLASERFGAEVIPALVFASFVSVRNYYALPSALILKHAPDGALYLRAPCAAGDQVTVHPWWDLASEAKVCPDSYRPTKWTLEPGEHSYKTAMTLACDSQVGSPELETHSLCGCGPNLIRCLRDEDQYNQLTQSFQAEIKRTAAYVVDHDLPMSTLFTSNATFRDRNAELYYRRQKIGSLQLKHVARELEDLDDWPAQGKWAPRDEIAPGQHAGVLTAPQILHWLPDRRQRQRGYYEMMWCNLRNSFGATTHKVLEINAAGNNFFVAESWQRLAHTPLCMNCHARLDYGSQFFNGYPDSRASVHYIPALAGTGKGPLYGKDLDDPRGEAPLTPQGFAQLATAQPDFQACMANHFVSHVLGDRATPDDVRAIEDVVAKTQTFKATMKVALERFALRWHEPAPVVAAAVAVATAAGSGSAVPAAPAIAPELRALLDQHCGDCHHTTPYSDQTDGDDVPFDFAGAALPRALMVSMTDQVAYGMMPKDQPLDPATRERLVGLLIDSLWTDPAAREESRRYYLGKARGAPAQQLDNALFMIAQRAHAPSGLSWGALERGIWSDQSTITPSFLTITGLDAAHACARAGGAIEDCVRQATALGVLSRWPPATTR